MKKISIILLFLYSINVWSKQVEVAIIDTGVNLEHSEFKPFLYRHPKDGLQAYDFITEQRKTIDTQGHGTNIASILILNNKHKFKIIPLRFTDGSDSALNLYRDMKNFNQALEMAIGLEVDVINISYTHLLPRSSEEELIKKAKEKNIIIVAAAGNNNSDLSKLDNENKTYPCNYNYENVICVGNWDFKTNERELNSNYGGRVQVYADGNNVIGLGKNSKDSEDLLNIMSGTSQAAAKVSRWIVHQKKQGKKYHEILELVKLNQTIKDIP